MSTLRALLLFSLLIPCLAGFAQVENTPAQLADEPMNATEAAVAKALNAYREKRGLKAVPLSRSLCFVARTHAIDQTGHHQYKSKCNLHSWSEAGNWSSCCYTPDHKQASCMWDKPRELTQYQGDGFEISFYSTYKYNSPEDFAADAIRNWISSHSHHEIMVNLNHWRTVEWKAMGVGVYGNYINVWFGKLPDGPSPTTQNP